MSGSVYVFPALPKNYSTHEHTQHKINFMQSIANHQTYTKPEHITPRLFAVMMHQSQSRRGSRDAYQPEAVSHAWRIGPTEHLYSYHPSLPAGRAVMRVRAEAANFSYTGRDEYTVATTVEGYTGVLVTYKNACQAFPTHSRCHFGDRCKFYHFPPGEVVSNLPQRLPASLGVIDSIICDEELKRLVVWTGEQEAHLKFVKATQMQDAIDKLEKEGEGAAGGPRRRRSLRRHHRQDGCSQGEQASPSC